MNEILDSYVELSFDGPGPHREKMRAFELNYRRFFPDNNSLEVLDIGIGRGEMLLCMRDWGYHYQGIDISPSTVRFCKGLGLNCAHVSDTNEQLAKWPDCFGLITLLDVLEHIKKDAMIATLGAIRRSLVRGGVLIVQVPNAQARDAQLHRYNDITHEFAFMEHSLRQVLMASGFSDISFYGFEDYHRKSFKTSVLKCLRSMIWWATRMERRITANLNPRILNPVLFAVAVRTN